VVAEFEAERLKAKLLTLVNFALAANVRNERPHCSIAEGGRTAAMGRKRRPTQRSRSRGNPP
jgi:hypothetical protein